MKTTIAALLAMMSLIFSAAAFAGQIARTTSGGREIVTLVDHGSWRGHPVARPRYSRSARMQPQAEPVTRNCESQPVANAEVGDEMAAGVVESMLAARLVSSDSADLPDIGTDPTAYRPRVLGAVPNGRARDTVGFQAMSVSGTAVRNEVRLLDYAPSVDLVYDDAHVVERVERALLAWPQLHGADIHVDVDQGITTLTGTVSSADESAVASTAAASAPGVYIVQNRLSLRPPDDRTLAAAADSSARLIYVVQNGNALRLEPE